MWGLFVYMEEIMAKKPVKLSIGDISKTYILIERVENVVRPNGKKRPVWRCRCIECNLERNIESQALVANKQSDCFCISGKPPKVSRDFGGTTTKYKKEVSSYYHMIGRCYDEKESGYENYGGRGITVSASWKEDFRNFLKDMGERPDKHVLDRIDPDGDYCKENCRWVDRNTSSFNTRKHKTNTSGRTGVYWFERVGKWIAAIHYNNKQIHLGYFDNFEDAASARASAEIEYFGVNKL